MYMIPIKFEPIVDWSSRQIDFPSHGIEIRARGFPNT